MLGLIVMAGVVYWLGTTFGDDVGVAATAIAVLIVLILFCRGWSETSRAFGNWVRYWSRGIEPNERRKYEQARNRKRM